MHFPINVPDWARERVRQVHLDFHIPEFPREALANCDPRATADTLAQAGVNVVALFAKCHFGNSYYPTEAGHRHRALKGDLLGDTLAACRSRDIKVIVYYSLGTDEWALRRNPDWYQVDEAGRVRDGNGTVWHRPCMNSPYREELVLPQTREIFSWYELDGFFIDIPYIQHHRCFCRYCRRKFREEYGRELEPGLLEREPALVREFALDSAARCIEEMRMTGKALKPEVPILVNCAWKMGEPARINQTADVGVWESQPAAGSWLYHSFKSRWSRRMPAPSQIMTVRFSEGWGLLTCKTAEQLKYEAAAILANGGILNIGDQANQDGSLQKGVYETYREVFSFVKEREACATRARSVPHLALITGYTSNRYWDKGDPAALGAAKTLIEGHQQFDVFLDGDFGGLDGYSAAVLTESARLDEPAIARLDAFVQGGGLLVASGRAAFGLGPAPRPADQTANDPMAVFDKPPETSPAEFRLAGLLGVDFLEFAPYRCAYLGAGSGLCAGAADIPLLLDGATIKAVPTTAETLAGLVWPSGESVPPRAFRHELPPPGEPSAFPAVTLNRRGAGLAVWIAADVFSQYWNTNHYWLKRVVNGLIDRFDADKPFIFEASPNIETVLTEKNGRRYLHLVRFESGHSGSRDKAFYDPIETILPAANLELLIRGTGTRSVTQLPEGRKLSVEKITRAGGDWARVLVPELRIWTILEIEGA